MAKVTKASDAVSSVLQPATDLRSPASKARAEATREPESTPEHIEATMESAAIAAIMAKLNEMGEDLRNVHDLASDAQHTAQRVHEAQTRAEAQAAMNAGERAADAAAEDDRKAPVEVDNGNALTRFFKRNWKSIATVTTVGAVIGGGAYAYKSHKDAPLALNDDDAMTDDNILS